MKEAIAKLYFTAIDGHTFKVPTTLEWFTCTKGCNPNDWSIHIRYLEPIQPDGTVMAKIDFLTADANYLLKPGTKFQLLGAFSQFKCQVEVIE